jgi:peptidoglycan-associated lipoprotein
MNRQLIISMAMPLVAIACGADPTPPPSTASGPAFPPAETAETGDAAKDPTKGNVQISDEIRRACGISDHDAYFAYNSAQVAPQARSVLQKLATCFKDGPLKGRKMVLVGHADQRGDPEYNLLLGGKRADGVRGMLMKYGLGKDRMSTSSRGEMDASGSDPDGWAKDRRVDVDVGS